MFKINDIITVKPGVEDPDFGGDIGGWQGRITEIDTGNPDDPLVTIEWDAHTLKNMPKDYLKRCFKEGYDHEVMVLGLSDVMPAANRSNTDDNRATVLESLDKEYKWEDLGEQGLRIKAVEDACEHDYALMNHWFEYLEEHVTLPVKAKYIGESSINVHHGTIIEINGFEDANDDFGVIASAKYQRRWIQVPLCDLEIVEISPETQALDDYIVWYVNR